MFIAPNDSKINKLHQERNVMSSFRSYGALGLIEGDACYKHLAPDGAKSGAAWQPAGLTERHSLSAHQAAEPQPTVRIAEWPGKRYSFYAHRSYASANGLRSNL